MNRKTTEAKLKQSYGEFSPANKTYLKGKTFAGYEEDLDGKKNKITGSTKDPASGSFIVDDMKRRQRKER